jgi:flagellar biosynthesis GTPase FlhF
MSISEVKVGSLIRVKVGRNIILAKVVEILDGAVRVCSLANNKEFNVPQSRVQLDEHEAASTEQQGESTVQTEQASTEQQDEKESAEPEAQSEASVEVAETEPQSEASEQEPQTEEASEPTAEVEQAEATVEVVPEDEAAEFTPSGEDQDDEYVINPAHESDKPKKHMSLLSAAVIVLKDAGPEHPMNCKEILEAIVDRQLWTPTPGKTPEQTLYGSIFREINTKEHPRIVKSSVKGKFVIAE